jgi:hypothetical protein
MLGTYLLIALLFLYPRDNISRFGRYQVLVLVRTLTYPVLLAMQCIVLYLPIYYLHFSF